MKLPFVMLIRLTIKYKHELEEYQSVCVSVLRTWTLESDRL